MGILLGKWKLFAGLAAVIAIFFFAWTFRGYMIENAALKQTLALSRQAAEKSNELTHDLDMINSSSNLRGIYEEIRKPEYSCVIPASGVSLYSAEKTNHPD